MFKFVVKALAGLVLTKDAQKAVGRIHASGGKTKGKSPFDQRDSRPTPGAGKTQAISDAQNAANAIVTPERAELIRQAMAVRNAKQTILADLDDETRGKLVATAMKALLREGRDES